MFEVVVVVVVVTVTVRLRIKRPLLSTSVVADWQKMYQKRNQTREKFVRWISEK